MNRDRGISSNLQLYLHLISPTAHTHSPSYFICLCLPLDSLENFVSLSFFPFCCSAHDSLSFFSYKFLDYLVFISNPPPPTPTPLIPKALSLSNTPSFGGASAPLGSCVLLGVVRGLALCPVQSVSAALAHPSARPAPWSLINESSVVFVYQPVIC